MTHSSHTGGCICGAIRFEVHAQPYRIGLCHCFDCRKQHGSAFNGFAIFPADQVAFSGDEPALYAAAERAGHYFCRRCGSPVFSRSEGSDEVELFIGSFDQIDLFTPTYESWTCRREEWLPTIPAVRHCYERDRAGAQRTET